MRQLSKCQYNVLREAGPKTLSHLGVVYTLMLVGKLSILAVKGADVVYYRNSFNSDCPIGIPDLLSSQYYGKADLIRYKSLSSQATTRYA